VNDSSIYLTFLYNQVSIQSGLGDGFGEMGRPKKPGLQPQGPMEWAAKPSPGGLGYFQLVLIGSDFSINLLIEGFDN